MAVKKKVAKKKSTKKKAVAKKATSKRVVKHPLKINSKEWDKKKVTELIFERLGTSNDGLGQILAAGCVIGGKKYAFPGYTTIMTWMQDDSEIRERYARAHEAKAEFMANEILDIVDNQAETQLIIDGEKIFVNGKPVMVRTHESIAHAKLRADARKWLMAKMKPKKYGDSTMLKHADADGESAPTLVLNMGIPQTAAQKQEKSE